MVQATSSRKLTMKFFIYLMFCIFSIFPAHSQLSGTKTIDPSGGDYASFTAAINALVTQGVNGPVILNVASGTYTEQVRIREIPGASNVNTITIQSASSDSSSVILTYSSTLVYTNWTLRIDSTDYLTIRKITIQASGASYARCIDINGNATNVTIENCRIIGYNTTSSDTKYSLLFCILDPTDKITIQKNLFVNGSYGIYFSGPSTSVLATGTSINNNVFKDQSQFGIWLRHLNAPLVNHNTIETRNVSATGIQMEYCDNAAEVQKQIDRRKRIIEKTQRDQRLRGWIALFRKPSDTGIGDTLVWLIPLAAKKPILKADLRQLQQNCGCKAEDATAELNRQYPYGCGNSVP